MSLEEILIDLTKAINRNTNTLLTLTKPMPSPDTEATPVEDVKAEPVKKGRGKPAAKPATPQPVIEAEVDEDEEGTPALTADQLGALITKAISLNKPAVAEYMQKKKWSKVHMIPLESYDSVAAFLNKTIKDATKEDDGEDFSFGDE